MSEERFNSWRIIGEFLGYPSCCIEEFCKPLLFFQRSDICKEQSANGFIPCPNCANKLKNNEVTYDTLINNCNRKCSIKFTPDSNFDNDEIITKEALDYLDNYGDRTIYDYNK